MTDENGVVVIDTGLALDHALTIGDSYLTYYALANTSPYPTLADTVSGYGFDQLIKVNDWGEALLDEDVDTVVFTDIGFGALADLLRSKGYNVFGTDRRSEQLESNRIWMRLILNDLGIPTAKAKIIKGIERLKQYVKNVGKKVYIKPNYIRGEFETFGCSNVEELKLRLSTPGLQILGDYMQFVCEEELNGVEVGFDAFITSEGFLDPIFFTLECKGQGNATVAVSKDDNPWSDFINKIEDWLVDNGYRGMFCAEGFYDGNQVFVTDITSRFPYICSHAYPRMIENFADVVVEVAKGETPEIKLNAKRSIQIGLYTDLIDAWNILCHYDDFDYIRQFFGLRKGLKANDYVYTVPGDVTIGAFVASGKSMKQCINEIVERIDEISIPSTYCEPYEFYAYFQRQKEKLSEYGFDF